MKDIYKKYKGDNETQIKQLEKEILIGRRDNVEDRFFAAEIDNSTYNNAKARYERKIIEINGNISEFKLSFSGYTRYLNEGLPLLTNLRFYYKKALVGLKQKMIGSIFPEKMIFEDKKYRTKKMNEVFNLIHNNINGFENIATKKGQSFDQPFRSGSPYCSKLQLDEFYS